MSHDIHKICQKFSHNGWILLDKPVGISSFQAITPIKKILHTKAGHTGTLDPFASGLLLVALGGATKLIEYVMQYTKEYAFSIRFGRETDTLDPTGKVIKNSQFIPHINSVREAIQPFIGTIEQVPPAFSAIKIGGCRAYSIARTGQSLTIQSRRVTCYNIDFVGVTSTSHINLYNEPIADDEFDEYHFTIQCSKGFYIRSFARDLAHSLGTVGYVTKLRRTSIGKFSVNDNTTKIAQFHNNRCIHESDLTTYILPSEDVLDTVPVIIINDSYAKLLAMGQCVALSGDAYCINPQNILNDSIVMVKTGNVFVAICRFHDKILKPLKVFCF